VDSLADEFTLVITGRDLAEEALVHIVGKAERSQPLQPTSIGYSADETSLTAVFPAEGLALGPYDIVITNPGGITQTIEGFSVGFSRSLDINTSLGYALLVPFYGYLFNTYDAFLYPLGFYGRVSAVPFKRLWGWIGFELSPGYADLKTENDAYNLTGHMISVDADVLFQKWNEDYTMALNLRLGGGFVTMANIKFNNKDGSESANTGTVVFAINAGVSVEKLVWKNIFVEAGLSYVQFITSQSPAPGFVRVNAAVGRRF
jgi:hypothetical protein